MKRSIPFLILAIACPLAWAGATPPREQSPGAVAALHAPAVVAGERPAAAWLAATPRGRRIFLASPPAAPAVQVGPPGSGHDGPPAMAALGPRGLMVIAARTDGPRTRLWSQIADEAGWSPAAWLPATDGRPDNPAIAARGESAWAVWPADGVDGTRLVAAEWRDGVWSAVETVPTVRGRPGLPAMALGNEGRPMVIWSESDGTDEEIWLSRRTRNGWTRPRALSHNDVPDILPSLGADGAQWVAAWSQLGRGGEYRAVVVLGGGGSWSRPRRLGSVPAGGISVAAASPPTVVWSELTGHGSERVLTGAELMDGTWHTLGNLGAASNARHHANRSDGQLAVAWHQGPDVAVGTATREGGWRTTMWRGTGRLSHDQVRRPVASNAYVGFGDSVTEGLVRYDEEISYVEPYTTFLQTWTSNYLGEPSVVVNAGLAGEFTAEGVSRIKNYLEGQRATLILEGANDMANRLDPATAADNLTLMVRSARDAGSIPVIGTVLPFTSDGFSDSRNVLIAELNLMLQQMAKAEGAIFVDQYSAFFGKAFLYSDYLHPNDVGYQEMARVWFRGIKPLLDQFLLQQDIEDDLERDKAFDRGRPPVRGRE